MILSKEAEIKLGPSNYRYYRELNYNFDKSDTSLKVNVNDLLPTTKVDVLVECDFCKNVIKTSYKNYHYNYFNFGLNMFSCSSKCTLEKTKINTLKKWGVEYSNQRTDIKEHTKKSSLKRIKKYDMSLIKDDFPIWYKYLITKEVITTINKWNIKHLEKLGYIGLVLNQKWTIPVQHLMDNSSVKVECICECGNIVKNTFQKFIINFNRSNSYNCKSCNNITYKKTCLHKYGYENPSFSKDCIEKNKKTCLEKYGNEYVIASKYSIEKTKITFNERYGGHPMKTDIKFKGVKKSNDTKLERGLIVPENLLNEWEIYRKIVRKLTNRNRNRLFEEWNGLDYYDGDYIKENFNVKHTDYDFPTIDHKMSIIYGFKNNIPPEDIGDISNLCITKKGINSSKSFLTEEDYIKKSQS